MTGVGVMVLFGWWDLHVPGPVLSGGLLAIGFAYMVRFLSVAYQPLCRAASGLWLLA